MDALSTRPRPPARRATTLRGSASNAAETANATAAATPPSSTSALTALPNTPRTLQRRSRGGRVSLDYRGSSGSAPSAGPDAFEGAHAQQHAALETDDRGGRVDYPRLNDSNAASLRPQDAAAHRRRSLNQPDQDCVDAAQAVEEPFTHRQDLGGQRLDHLLPTCGHTTKPSEVHHVVPSSSAQSPALAQVTAGPSAGVTASEDRHAPSDGLSAAAYEQLSRADLERLLGEADRIIREKEQELTVFTTAGQGLLDEYNALKQKHDSLRHRLPAELCSPAGSPAKQRQPGSSASPLRSDGSPSHARKESLRSGDGSSVPSARARDHSRALQQADPWLTPTSTVRYDFRTPSGSPISSRDIIKSGSISTSSKSGSAPSSRFLFSPSAAQADEAAILTQANYALTLQLNEVQADSEAAEREGRKRLRRLERELQSLRADLERVEQRNAILESQAENVKEKENELAKSARAIRVAPRKILQPVTPDRRSHGRSPVRAATVAPQQESPTLIRSSGAHRWQDGDPSFGPIEAPQNPALVHAFPTLSAVPQIETILPVLSPRSVYRTVSTSSLVPLPPPVRIDPSLEQQQDELVDQLIAKIDELQDTNYGFLSERQTMFGRLAEVQEEMYDWKERCEELEDENQQHRLIGWRDAVQSADRPLACEEEDAHPGSSQAPPPRPDRPHSRRPMRRRLAADSNSISLPSTAESSQPVRSPSTVGEMSPSLGEELDKGDASAPSRALQQLYGWDATRDVEDSVIFHDGADLADPSRGFDGRHHALVPCDKIAVTTSDDILRSGGLRWAGHPDADKYEALEQATDELAPDWQDQPPLSRAARLSRLQVAKERLGTSSGAVERHTGAGAEAFRKSRSGPDGRRRGVHSRQPLLDLDQQKPRRRRALRRLSFEAERRQTAGALVRADRVDSDAESTASSAWSDFEHVEQSLVHRSDYYPTASTARYRRTMLAAMLSDSAAQQIVTFLTWIRFMAILTTAVIFAVWQGPRKTLSLVDGHRRRLQ